VLDLDAVTRVRRFGTAGVSRMWDQIQRVGPGIHFPMYGGSVQAGDGFQEGSSRSAS
jgi:formamidase